MTPFFKSFSIYIPYILYIYTILLYTFFFLIIVYGKTMSTMS
uniref:Uncharacterized protein n=1 Tax=Siphoviridae sp. ct43U4 TaxID=2826285 RepID=A0A8S5MZU9_9CAUD|nr:MAG TPA: hypothetical protein [Siphoviridae sp. ct43U4]DAH58604.1 MAG TPA: hypothetical protein [Caudoviricetes sp.]